MFLTIQIDVEGTEFTDGGLKDWIQSGALKNVNQIALELHVVQNKANER